MPSNTLAARWEEKDVERRGLRSCALGRRRSCASRDHVTADDSRALQRNSSVQFVGSHN